MAEDKAVKCPICGKPYKVYMFMAGDQSACKIHTELYRDAMRLKGKTEISPKPAPIFTVASEKETAFSAIGSLAALMALIVLAVVLG